MLPLLFLFKKNTSFSLEDVKEEAAQDLHRFTAAEKGSSSGSPD